MTSSDPPAAPLYCVPCARKAAADYGNTGYPEQLPRFSPSPGGPVTGYRTGYRVPVAVAIAGGHRRWRERVPVPPAAPQRGPSRLIGCPTRDTLNQ